MRYGPAARASRISLFGSILVAISAAISFGFFFSNLDKAKHGSEKSPISALGGVDMGEELITSSSSEAAHATCFTISAINGFCILEIFQESWDVTLSHNVAIVSIACCGVRARQIMPPAVARAFGRGTSVS